MSEPQIAMVLLLLSLITVGVFWCVSTLQDIAKELRGMKGGWR